MAFNISTFKTQGLVYGGARPSQFEVLFSVPLSIGIQNYSVNKATFVCRSAELPSSDVGSVDAYYFGRPIRLSGDRSFGTWTVSIMNDEDFAVRSLFETWSNSINRLVANIQDPSLVYQTQYKTDLQVWQYGKDGSVLRTYRIVGAWPTSVSNIGLDWNATNALEEFSVTFAYDWWLPEIEQNNRISGTVNQYSAIAQSDV